ncbi:MAG: hypothetical protein EA362_07735 [Saprospirales bacterium]|nr:MAG: hypothetical protein EA362_07735 [Saprospirales bacterium]
MTYPFFNKLEIVSLPEDRKPEYIPFEKTGNPPVLVISKPLNEDEKSLLSKIMQAIGRTIGKDFLLVELPEKSSATLSEQWLQEKSIIISFGLNFSRLGFQLENIPYRLLKLAGNSFLLCDNLSKISQTPDLKRRLWSQLKSLNA